MTSPPAALELIGIDKRFGAVHANDHIDLRVMPATVHGIIGENGAGKSTLMSIIYGFYQADSGRIQVEGRDVDIRDSSDAIALGIGMVHQHFMLVENLSVLDNIILGAEDSLWLGGSKRRARAKMLALQERFGLDVDLDARVDTLPVGLQQRVEIAKALYREARILILDEPTGVLTPQEADQLFDVLNTLRDQGVTVLLITHKLREIMSITDHVSVMRQGAMVAHRATAQTNPTELAELMVGRPVLLEVDKAPATPGAARMQVEGLGYQDERGVARLSDISLTLRSGEILGIAGVSGNGQSELLQVLAGTLGFQQGQIHLALESGTQTFGPGDYPDPNTLRRERIAHVPEDRLGDGLIKNFSAASSCVLGYHYEPQFGPAQWFSPTKIDAHAAELMQTHDVRPQDPSIRSANMSGGNQQKLILAREMSRSPHILLIGQPTRGVDIGAIEMIYKALIEARDAGAAILLVSVELDEILALSDRIAVMCAGRIVGTVDAQGADPKHIGLMMANASGDNTDKNTGATA